VTPEEQLKAQIATQLLCAPLDSAAGIILQRSPHREYVPDALQLAATVVNRSTSKLINHTARVIQVPRRQLKRKYRRMGEPTRRILREQMRRLQLTERSV